MKTLVVIASYGTANDKYLSQVLDEFRAMRHRVDIVVTSNIPRNLGSDVEVTAGLPSHDPWSLGFAHKAIFGERLKNYDLFVYSEDDILVKERNLEAFLRVTEVLPKDELAGFLRTESDLQGKRYFSEVRQHFHWDPGSVCSRGNYRFAYFTTEHAGCYALTRDQLRRAIESGGFLVGPHEGRHDLLVTAATDPYTQCGFRKMICISHLEDFLVPHLSNKYALMGGILPAEEFDAQLSALRHTTDNGKPKGTLFPVETKVYHEHWSKSYYEPCQEELLSLVPHGARDVLSIGCGWGETEKRLIEKGMRVKAIPMDSVIAASAEWRGVQIVHGDTQAARESLSGERFDCLLFSNVLHLVRDPVQLLARFAELLAPGGRVVVSVPNLSWLRRLARRIRLHGHAANPTSYDESGLHVATGRVLRRWFRQAGLRPDQVLYGGVKENALAKRLSVGLAKAVLGSDVYVSGILKRSTE